MYIIRRSARLVIPIITVYTDDFHGGSGYFFIDAVVPNDCLCLGPSFIGFSSALSPFRWLITFS